MNAPAMLVTAEELAAQIHGERAANPDLQIGLDALKDSASEYLKAQAYFEDDVPEVFASTRLRRAIQRTGTDFRINFARVPVTAVVNRLEISSIQCPNNAAATEWIDQQWQDNQLDLRAPRTHLRAGEFGDAFVIVWPVAEEDEESTTGDLDMPETTGDSPDSTSRESVEITYNSPLCCRIIYDPENDRRKAFAIKRWKQGARYRVDLYYPDHIEKYVTKDDVKNPSAADFYVHHDDDDETVNEDGWPINPYGEIPVFHFRTDDGPYGTPDHKGFYGTQNILRKLIVTHMATVDYQGFPQRYALVAADGDSSEAAAGDEDEFSFAEESTGATRNQSGSSASQFNAGPGELWWMRGVKDTGTYNEADPEVFLKPMLQYLRMGAQASETPVRLFDFASGQLPSGASQVQFDGPFNKKCHHRTLSYGATWRELWQFALKIAGFGRVPVVVNWAPVQHVSGLDGWQTILLQIQAGVPARQAFCEAGYTDEQITAWLGEEEDDLPTRIALLLQIAQLLQAFGAASSFDLLKPEQAREIIAAVLEAAPQLAGKREDAA